MSSITPGWYHADGDPTGTVRYWDGAAWIGDPVVPPQAAAPPPHAPPPPVVMVLQPVSTGRRIGGQLFDLAIWFAIIAPIWFFDALDEAFDQSGGGNGPPPTLFANIALLCALGLIIATGATTPGKWLVGIGIETVEGGKPEPIHALKRIAPLAVWFVPGIGGALWTLLQIGSLITVSSDREQSIPDMIAGTKVVPR